MMSITREEWERKHQDFKSVDEDGQHYILRYEPETGATVLEPVQIVDEKEAEDG